MIAHAAGGSLRDAENILQQLFSYYGDQLDWEKVSVTLGISNDPRIDELIHNILNRDISSGLKTITNVYDEGIDLHQFNQGLIQHLRELLMIINNCYEAVDVTEETLASMKDMAQHFTLEGLLNVIKAFSRLDLRQDNYSTLPFEVAFIESVLTQKKLNNPKVEERTKKTAGKSRGTPADSTSKMDSDIRKSTVVSSNAERVADVERTDKQSSRTADDNNGSISLVDDSEDTVQTENNIKPDAIDNNSKTAERSFDKDDIAQINNQWKDFIRSLRGEGSGGNLDAFLRSACELVGIDGDTLILGFYYPFHKEKIEDRKYRHLVEKKLKEVYNHPYKINCVLIEKGKHKEGMSEPSQYSPLIKAALELGAKIKDG
jgi:DNA polymerase-3 subunit gamma/tau